MDEGTKKRLVIEHARKTAALAGGDLTVKERLTEIEQLLNLNTTEIAQLATDEYLRDYK